MPELLSRSKQETAEFKNRLDAGFGPDTGRDWFAGDEVVSDDDLAAELESQQTAALEKTYAAPAYGEKPAGYSAFEEMLSDEPLLPAGETTPLLPEESATALTPELKALEDAVNRSDYDDFSKPDAPIRDEAAIIEGGFGMVPNILVPEPSVRRTPRHAKELHVEDGRQAATAETKETTSDSRFDILLSAALSSIDKLKAEQSSGTATEESTVRDIREFKALFEGARTDGMSEASLGLIEKLFLKGYEAQLAVGDAAKRVTEAAPLTTDSHPATYSVEVPLHVPVENAAQAETTDRMPPQDELAIDDEIENVAMTGETAPVAAKSVLEEAPADTRGTVERTREAAAGLRSRAFEKLQAVRADRLVSAPHRGVFAEGQPVTVYADGVRQDGWSIENKLYDPVRKRMSYDILAGHGKVMAGISEAQLSEWRDAAEASAGEPSDAKEAAESVATRRGSRTEQATDGPRHRAENGQNALQHANQVTKESAREIIDGAKEWWKANGESVKDRFRPSYWAARWNTMVVKEIEGFRGEGMTDQEKKEFRRSRETLGIVAGAAGVLTLGALASRGIETGGVHHVFTSGGGGTFPSPDTMPDMPSGRGGQTLETFMRDYDPGIGQTSISHGETIAHAFDAKDFIVPKGGSVERTMSHLGLGGERWKSVQFDLLKLSPKEFYVMDDGNVGIASPGELSQPVRDFLNALAQRNG